MNFLSLLEAKRDGTVLTSRQIQEIVSAYTSGAIPDYQMAALLMAIYFRGLDTGETRALTLAMRDSGQQLSFPDDGRPLADKHSTGGVGDKVSLPLAPLLACLGLRVPMISGRGLGITGGTLDKLESIPGFSTALEPERIVRQVQEVGCVICGQTATMVPADKALYALRDVTATVPSIPLITASILSKKLAEGLDALILDVKFGAAAFMPDIEQARTLATAMVRLGQECGVRVGALLTGMDAPLGRAVGNWLEVKESVECLENRGSDDLRELVLACAAHLLLLTGQAESESAGRDRAMQCLESGRPREKWNEMLRAQGADLPAFENLLRQNTSAPAIIEIKAPQSGYVAGWDARLVGELVRDMGGGRLHKGSILDLAVGIDDLAVPGTWMEQDDVLATIHARRGDELEDAVRRLLLAVVLSESPVPMRHLIAEVVEDERV